MINKWTILTLKIFKFENQNIDLHQIILYYNNN